MFEPIPSIRAPSETRKWQRSWMWGSQAACPTIVSPCGEHRGHHGVLGRHHRRLVEEHPLAPQPVRAKAVGPVQVDLDTELHERVDVRVEAAAADHVASRRRHGRSPEAGQQRPGEQERRPDLAAERRVELRLGDGRRIHPHLVRPRPLGRRAEVREDLHHRLDVADARDVLEDDGLRGEHGGRENRERPVLVARRTNAARERTPALDHERLHSGAVSYPAPWRSPATGPGRR